MTINLTAGKTTTSEAGPKDGERQAGSSRTEPLRSGSLRSGSLRSGSLRSGSLRSGSLRGLMTATGVVGIGYTLSWIAGLLLPAPSPAFSASGAGIVTALAGHGLAVAAQYALTEGLPAAGIAVISIALASAARRRGAIIAARFALASGVLAAIVSAVQFGLGLALVATSEPGTAHVLFATVNRLDGVKMLALAVLGAAAVTMTLLPRWLRYTGLALAVSIAISGLVYLLLLQSLAMAAGPALILLLGFITGTGVVLGGKDR
jgi:hypothetical protein